MRLSGWSKSLCQALVLTSCLGTSGCGFLLQSVLGWSDEEVTPIEEQHRVRLDSIPTGATIGRKGPGGSYEELGVAPLEDNLTLTKERVKKEPQSLGLVLGGLLTLGGSAALTVYGVGNVGSDDVGESAGGLGLVYLGALGIITGIAELIVAPIWEAAGGGDQGIRMVKKSDEYTYTAKLNGQEAQKFVYVGSVARLTMPMNGAEALINEAALTVKSPPPPPPPPAVVVAPPPPPPPTVVKSPPPPPRKSDSSQWVVAVMDVEDVNAGSRKGLSKSLVRNLGDQLRIFVAQNGLRTVDRSSQERVFKDQLQRIKSDSYNACYDDSCQIELGKALAATHIRRSRITRFGSRCVLNAEMIDLRAEVTIKAASARGGCEAEGFLTMSEEVSKAVTPG